MAISSRKKNQHLLWRAAFGPMAEMSVDLDTLSQKKLWELLKSSSSSKPLKLETALTPAAELYKDIGDISDMQRAINNPELRKKLREESRQGIKALNLQWLDEMINSEAQLREKMSFFWHGHFACRVQNIYFQQDLLHIIRSNALGSFAVMLKEISKSASMLQFLNNQQNKKSQPNENFAREVMELFTMGRGNYTENDVKEAARAFTGWGFNFKGEFVFRKQQHDYGTKVFLGKAGNFTGEDILDILLEKQATADFITQKIYRFFVNDNPDPGHVQWLSKRFYQNNYDIGKLLEDIFGSEWFYEEKNVGSRIKSPIELLAGTRRFLPMQLEKDESQLLYQKLLGQELFSPPNVAGWAGGKNWIDSSTLMLRLMIPQVMTSKEPMDIRPKSDDDTNMGQMIEDQIRLNRNRAFAKRGGAADIDWQTVYKVFEKTERKRLFDVINNALIQTNNHVPETVLSNFVNSDSRENFIKSSIIHLMSTPEYQMC